MKKEEVQTIIESIMKKLTFTESIDELVVFYQREHYPIPLWLNIKSENNERADTEHSIWKDILPNMHIRPEMVHISETICPECGEKCIGLYFLSPPWTWKALCGRGGHMVICPNCPKMVEFELTIMN